MSCHSCSNGTAFDEAGNPHACVICNPPRTTGQGRAAAIREENNHRLEQQRKEAEKRKK